MSWASQELPQSTHELTLESNMQSPEVSDIRRQPLSQDRQRQPRIWILNANSNEASKSFNAKIVRSHAAKEGHYRQQERRRGHLEVRQYQPTVLSKKHKRYASKRGNKIQAQIRPQTISNPEPQSSLSCYQRDPSQPYVEITSHAEIELIDHYVREVVHNAYVNCGAFGSRGEPFIQQVDSSLGPMVTYERWLPSQSSHDSMPQPHIASSAEQRSRDIPSQI
ncbi:hypothetical protein V8C43DRAFT_52048 [Trichoderma afarasin]